MSSEYETDEYEEYKDKDKEKDGSYHSDHEEDDEHPPCFLTGSRIVTDRGERAVEDLRRGDRVLTRDHGYQPLCWTGTFDLRAAPGATLAEHLRPVRIAEGALGPGLPARALLVSAQHRILLSSPEVALHFGCGPVFCAAAHLDHWPGVERPPAARARYVHLLLDRHAAIMAEGQWCESLLLGPRAQEIVSAPDLARLQLRGAAPGRHDSTAYPCLAAWEARLLSPPRNGRDTRRPYLVSAA